MRPRGLRDVIAAKDYPLQQRGSQGATRVRGMRDVMSAQGIKGRSVPASHAQRLAEISWMERETERLQREASILEASMQRIHRRLAEVGERRQHLLSLVREGLGISMQDTPIAAQSTDAPSTAERDLDVVALEY